MAKDYLYVQIYISEEYDGEYFDVDLMDGDEFVKGFFADTYFEAWWVAHGMLFSERWKRRKVDRAKSRGKKIIR